MPYYQSEFGLIQAQNEQLTRENKKLAEALGWAIAKLEINKRSLDVMTNELTNVLIPYQQECTCLPDLPDGRSRGHCYSCDDDVYKADDLEAFDEPKEIYIGGE